MRAFLLGFVIFLFACPQTFQPCIEYGDMRCNDTMLEICDPDGNWRPHTDCENIIPGRFTCTDVGGEAMCRRESEM